MLTDKIKIRGTFLSVSEPLLLDQDTLNVTTKYQIKSDTEILRDELLNIFIGCDKFSSLDKIVIKKVTFRMTIFLNSFYDFKILNCLKYHSNFLLGV